MNTNSDNMNESLAKWLLKNDQNNWVFVCEEGPYEHEHYLIDPEDRPDWTNYPIDYILFIHREPNLPANGQEMMDQYELYIEESDFDKDATHNFEHFLKIPVRHLFESLDQFEKWKPEQERKMAESILEDIFNKQLADEPNKMAWREDLITNVDGEEDYEKDWLPDVEEPEDRAARCHLFIEKHLQKAIEERIWEDPDSFETVNQSQIDSLPKKTPDRWRRTEHDEQTNGITR